MNWDNFLRYARETRALLARPRRDDDPTIQFFWCVVAVQAVFWSILPTLLQPNVSDETLEILAAGRQFAWGYPAHPPLGVWAASLLTSLSAPSIWPLHVLSQLCAVVSVCCAWKLARNFLQPWTALCAALVLLTGFSFTISAGTFTGAHLATMFWSLAILAFHEAFTNPRRRYWVLTGVALGLGLLASYGTVILFLAMGSFMVFDRRARRCWDSSWWMLALAAVAVVTLNHAWWLMAHDFQTLSATFTSDPASNASNLQRFAYLGSQAIGLCLIFLLLHPVVRRVNIMESVNSEENDQEFTRVYLTWLTALPAAILLVLSLFADPASGAMSGVSLWIYLGVLLLMWSRLDERRLAWRQVLLRTGAATGLLVAVFIAQQIMLPRMTQRASSTMFPGKSLANAVQTAWNRTGGTGSIPALAGTPNLVRNAAWYADGQPSALLADAALNRPEGAPANQGWGNNLVQTGGVVLWEVGQNDTQAVDELRQTFARQPVAVSVLDPVDLPWQTTAGVTPVRLGMAVVRTANYNTFEVSKTRNVQPAPVQTAGRPVEGYQPSSIPRQPGQQLQQLPPARDNNPFNAPTIPKAELQPYQPRSLQNNLPPANNPQQQFEKVTFPGANVNRPDWFGNEAPIDQNKLNNNSPPLNPNAPPLRSGPAQPNSSLGNPANFRSSIPGAPQANGNRANANPLSNPANPIPRENQIPFVPSQPSHSNSGNPAIPKLAPFNEEVSNPFAPPANVPIEAPPRRNDGGSSL